MMKLESGRSDVVVDDRLAGKAALLRLGYQNIFIAEPPLLRIPVFTYLHKKNIQIYTKLTETLQLMEKEGFIQRAQQQVRQKYLK